MMELNRLMFPKGLTPQGRGKNQNFPLSRLSKTIKAESPMGIRKAKNEKSPELIRVWDETYTSRGRNDMLIKGEREESITFPLIMTFGDVLDGFCQTYHEGNEEMKENFIGLRLTNLRFLHAHFLVVTQANT
jgi:hypothetical protein